MQNFSALKQPRMVLAALVWALTACNSGSGGDGGQGAQTIDPCTSTVATGLRVRTAEGETAQNVENLILSNPACETFALSTVNTCGLYLSNVEPANVNVDSSLGYVTQQTGSQFQICFRKGSVSPAQAGAISVTAAGFDTAARVNLELRRTPTQVPDLFRWYKAESYLPMADLTLVGPAG